VKGRKKANKSVVQRRRERKPKNRGDRLITTQTGSKDKEEERRKENKRAEREGDGEKERLR